MAVAVPWTGYRGQRLCLASQHQKERALARPFEAGLGVVMDVAGDLETNAFGSFSGERPRLDTAQRTCRLKAEAGLALSGHPLGLASEGSFGPHPAIPFLAIGIECLTFIDSERGLVIQESGISERTNFNQIQTRPDDRIDAWLERVGFPAHGLMVRPHRTGTERASAVALGLQCRHGLDQAIRQAVSRSEDGTVVVETDMRAHVNPTRMREIRRLGLQLVRRLRTTCPACHSPGWGLIERLPGLPCGWCGQPTERIAQEMFGCVACDHRQVRPRADGLQAADPGHCQFCNP
ncbi:MAG: DUF6671 family protein [Cyanobacteriota bacterium]